MFIQKEKIDGLRIIDETNTEWLIIVSKNSEITAISENANDGPYRMTENGFVQMFGESSLTLLRDV